MACIVMGYIVMARRYAPDQPRTLHGPHIYIVMAYIVMACIVMGYIVMARRYAPDQPRNLHSPYIYIYIELSPI